MIKEHASHVRARAPSVLGLGVVAVAITVYACTGGDDRTPLQITEPEVHSVVASSVAETSADTRARVKLAEAKYRWVGERHSAAMQDFRNNRTAFTDAGGSGPGKACRVGRALARKHAAAFASERNAVWSAADNAELDNLLVQVGACATASEANIFARIVAMRVPRDLSGNLGYYESAIYGAIDAWNGTTNLYTDVWAAMDAVGWQMLLTEDDTDIIGMMVDMTVSSHGDAVLVEWPDPETEVGWDASIFRRHELRGWPKWLRSVVKVVLRDVEALATAMTTMITADPNGDREEQRQDATWAAVGASVGASASATVNCINGDPPCSE